MRPEKGAKEASPLNSRGVLSGYPAVPLRLAPYRAEHYEYRCLDDENTTRTAILIMNALVSFE